MAWNLGQPEWPFVIDLDNDGACEVVVPSGSSLELRQSSRFQSTPWGAIEVVDGKTGQRLWNRQLVAMDEFLDKFTVGPDVDDDGVRELYAASFWRDEFQLFVDCLSGANGRSLWRSHRTLSAQGAFDWQLGDLTWWNHGNDGWPQLMINACDPGNPQRVKRIVLSAGTGTLVRFGTQLPHAIVAEFDGDQIDDLGMFCVKPGQTSDALDRAGTLQLVRGSPESWRKLTERLQLAGDLDRDGVCDLLRSHGSNVAAMSGATGRALWCVDVSGSHSLRQAVASHPGWDLNADAVDDLLIYVDDQYLGMTGTSPIQARDGATGNVLWEADLQAEIIIGTSALDCRDLDGDGRPEVLFASAMNLDYRHVNYSHQASQFWLVVLSGTDGSIRWRAPLTLDYGNVGITISPYQPRHMKLAVSYADLNGDRIDDILMPAETNASPAGVELRSFSGRDGTLLWRYELPATTHREQDLLDNVPPTSVGDLDGDGQLEVVVLAFEDGTSGRTAHVNALDAASGTRMWSWQAEVGGDCGNVYYGDARQARPRPLLLKDGETQRICLNLYNEAARLVVLDHAGVVVSDWQASQNEVPRQFRVWVCDSDSDAHDEIIMIRGGQLVLVSPDDVNRPLWSNKQEIDWHQILEITRAAEDDVPTIVAQSLNLDNRVVGVNARTGTKQWVCGGPTPHGPAWVGTTQATLLNASKLATDRQPVVHFAYNSASLVRHVADAKHPVRAPPTTKPVSHDPRLYRPLPWSPDRRGNRWGEFNRNAIWATFFAVTMLVVPFASVWRPVTRRRWSLLSLLLLPAVAGLFLLAALIPNPGEPTWPIADRLNMALGALPGLMFVAIIIWCAVSRNWSRLATWLTVSIVVTLIIVAFGLLVIHPREMGPLLPGERYATDDWYLIWLMGAYFTGCFAIVYVPMASLWARFRGTGKG